MNNNSQSRTVEIRWHGRGGQGVVTANEILAGAALREGKFIKAFPEFGPERMGAPIRAFARISDKPITVHSQVYYPDYVVVVDSTLLGQIDVTEGLRSNGAVIANYPDVPEKLKSIIGDKFEVHTVNATQIALEEIGRPLANTAMLGALAKISGIVTLESIIKELERKFMGKFTADVTAKNVKSVKRAYDEVI
ncbi:MAG: 2-oxoacid:acceptor oxidoreductase family protein [Methanomassiliicoccales archaeon]|nr:2-oxoacid:acceptor oxidoreductase family protein [Methanomassiliicoccales archaeon]